MFLKTGDSLLTVKRALEAKELARQQLRDQLDEVEKETRSKLQEIDIFNNQLKVCLNQRSLNFSARGSHQIPGAVSRVKK